MRPRREATVSGIGGHLARDRRRHSARRAGGNQAWRTPLMPAGISTSDFYNLLPELVLTGGALLVLIADVLLPRRSRVLSWLTLGVIGATLASLAPFTDTHLEVAYGLVAVDRFALFFKIVF